MQYGGLLTRRVLGVGSARAGSVARVPGRPLVMGSLNDAVDWALLWVEIIQPVVGAYRVRVCRCPGAVLRTGKRNARRTRRARHLTSGSGTCACTRNRDSARRSREEGLRAHIPSPFPSVCCSDRTLLTRRYGVNRGLTSEPASVRRSAARSRARLPGPKQHRGKPANGRTPLLDVVHRRAGLAVLALDYVGDRR